MQHELGRISGCLISDHLGFRVIRVRIGIDFGSSDLGSSRIFRSFRFRSGRISSHHRFRVVRVRVGSGSNQFDFLKKIKSVGFISGRIGRISQIGSNEFCHLLIINGIRVVLIRIEL
jgi:hypothetical protein